MSDISMLTDAFVISFNGTELTSEQDDALQSVVVEQTWSAADRIEIVIDDTRDDAPDVVVGDVVTAQIVSDTSTSVLFDGEIIAVGVRWNYETRSVVYEGYDARHQLTRQIVPTTHQNASIADVVAAVAGRHNLSAETPSSMSTTTYPNLIVASSDFATLQHIAHLTGCPWSLSGRKIVFDDRTLKRTVVTVTDADLTEFELRFTPIERSSDVEVHGWDPVNKRSVEARSVPLPKSMHEPPDELATATSLKQGTATSWSAGTVDQRHADQLADGIGRRLRDAEVSGRGATRGNAAIKPGAMIELEDVSPRVNGKYTISSASHVYGGSFGSLATRFRIGPVDTALADLLAPGVDTNSTAPQGVTIGIVTAIEDEGKQMPGAVRVKLPLISDDVQTGWARLMSIGGGTNRGVAFTPEIDDEVLVAFEHGDINRPYVLGTVWNQAGSAFEGAVKSNVTQQRRITSKLNNSIRFVDVKQGDATSGLSIEVDDAKTKLFFGYKETTITTEGRPLKLENGKASILLDQNEITIKADKITLQSASGDVEIKAMNVTVKANQKISAEANADVTVKSSGMGTLQAGGILTVKGSLVKIN